MSKLITKQYEHEGKSIDVLFTETAFFNATVAANVFGKSPKDWLKTESTKEYIEAVRTILLTEQNQLVRIVQGGNPKLQGTWLHHKLAVPYARWLNARFAVWCDEIIFNILRGEPAPQQPAYAHARALTIDEQAVNKLECTLKAGDLLKAPLHIVQQEAVKEVRKQTGIDYTPLLVHADAQQSIKSEEMMMEPTQLASELNFKSANEVNKWLSKLGLQTKVNKRWEPTDEGQEYCFIHSWNTKNKSGYNLKWNVSKLQTLLDSPLEVDYTPFCCCVG